MKKYADMTCGFIGVVLALVMLVLSINIGSQEGRIVGTALMPLVVSLMLLIFSAVLALRGFKSIKTYQEIGKKESVNIKGVIVMIVACLVYAYLLTPLGFVVSSVLFLFLLLYLMTKKEKRNYLKFGIITIISVLAIYFIFSNFFGIRLPQGILQGIM